MFKEIIQSFLPWILFFMLAGHTQQHLTIAIIIATIAALIVEIHGLKKGFILSWGTLMFFMGMFITVVLFNNQWIVNFSWIISNGALAAIAWISILIRKPFTIQYAKEQVSQDKWQHPLFLKINYLLTIIWGIIFLLGIGLHILKWYIPAFSGWRYEIISYLPSLFGIGFTIWYPKRNQKRNQA